ncbi:hypothetical protein VP1G_04042 [Cytospora mali]|uniref:Ricin B lectin domain-containing protein n=1 Tax=Cytospora mali TaxID=578113 RepID=A0A194UYF7_CYTMA|nr:hypothetical protein VP1G_04042 [Valsa mali var. pyri (nom. inval.)]
MSGEFDLINATPWAGTPGLYALFNVDGQTALDEDRDGKPQVIHVWEYGDSFTISNVNQLWQLADIGDKKWLIINKKTGQYLAAKADPSDLEEDSVVVVPQTGDGDASAAHWRITLAEAGDLYKLYIYNVKYNGDCLTLENGSGANGTKIKCATQNKVKKGQVWVFKKQN